MYLPTCFFDGIFANQKHQDDEEAILRANSTKYGLGASIWSENLEKARVKGRNILAINDCKERYMFIFPICSMYGNCLPTLKP